MLLFTGRYQDAFADTYGSSPHGHNGHYDSSPSFQTVPGSGIPTPEHWSPAGSGGVTSSNGNNSGANTPVEMSHLANPHHMSHPAYLPPHHSHRDPNSLNSLSHSHQLNGHHPHFGNGDIKPVIPTSMLGGYTGKCKTMHCNIRSVS